jgi:hypothetical protein
MPDLLTESVCRVTWDPDGEALVLVGFGDPMWSPVQVDGRQAVQTVARVRAAGIRAVPRGNEQHIIEFALCRDRESANEALHSRLAAMLALPRTGPADVLLEVDGFGAVRLADCAVESWAGEDFENLTRERVRITGGALAADEGTYIPGQTWGEISMLWPDLG